MGGRRSKAIGKEGERELKRYLEASGWLVADKETQGLAGDDLFARSPEGRWYSIECKKVAAPLAKYIAQAKAQASERVSELARLRKERPNSIANLLDIRFSKADWLLCWKPHNWGIGGHWVVFSAGGIEIWKEGK